MIFGNLRYDCPTSRVAKQVNFAKSKVLDELRNVTCMLSN
jgi:hypothetical protein